MFSRKAVMVLGVITLAALVFVGQAICQDNPQPRQRGAAGGEAGAGGAAGGRGGRGGFDPEAMRTRMEEFRKQQAEQMKTEMGATDEEWAVLQPKIEKIQTLQRDLSSGMRGGMMGRTGRGGRGGAQPGAQPAAQPDANAPAQTEIQKAGAALQTVVQNKEASAEQVSAALKAYRDARDKIKGELATAQKELKEIVTVKQEAYLVTRNVLE